jgi:hypothetical protein
VRADLSLLLRAMAQAPRDQAAARAHLASWMCQTGNLLASSLYFLECL